MAGRAAACDLRAGMLARRLATRSAKPFRDSASAKRAPPRPRWHQIDDTAVSKHRRSATHRSRNADNGLIPIRGDRRLAMWMQVRSVDFDPSAGSLLIIARGHFRAHAVRGPQRFSCIPRVLRCAVKGFRGVCTAYLPDAPKRGSRKSKVKYVSRQMAVYVFGADRARERPPWPRLRLQE